MTTDIAVREHDAALVSWTPSFAVAVSDMVARVDAKRDFFTRVMREGDHYGVIPGTKSKPTLLKPGAELLLAAMGLFVELSDAESPTRDYGDDGREGLIVYRRRCNVYRQTGTGIGDRMLVSSAEGLCSSRETKYRYRDEKPTCPTCTRELRRSTKANEWYCWKKTNGCGATFALNDPRIKAVGRIPNPELADVENTLLKMADKRALLAATLLATGCSDIFTQDMDDQAQPEARDEVHEAAPAETVTTTDARDDARPTAAMLQKIGKLYAELVQRDQAIKATAILEARGLASLQSVASVADARALYADLRAALLLERGLDQEEPLY